MLDLLTSLNVWQKIPGDKCELLGFCYQERKTPMEKCHEEHPGLLWLQRSMPQGCYFEFVLLSHPSAYFIPFFRAGTVAQRWLKSLNIASMGVDDRWSECRETVRILRLAKTDLPVECGGLPWPSFSARETVDLLVLSRGYKPSERAVRPLLLPSGHSRARR